MPSYLQETSTQAFETGCQEAKFSRSRKEQATIQVESSLPLLQHLSMEHLKAHNFTQSAFLSQCITQLFFFYGVGWELFLYYPAG